MSKKLNWVAVLAIGTAMVGGSSAQDLKPSLTDDVRASIADIDAQRLKGDLSFLSSDLLEGRNTPSEGLDIAAEFLASRFRAIGLDAPNKDGYFQVAPWPASGEAKTKVRNVIGVLPGSDPFLKRTYVIVSAHYDHLGVSLDKDAKDRIFNGANDDGSGAVGVVALASAMSKLHDRPRRTVVFALWFGEEKGLEGSRYYVQHPAFPLDKTVAMLNLEQIGRTDDTEGVRKRAFAMTGYDFSDLGPILRESARTVGIDIVKDPVKSDVYFDRSDNLSFANEGIPAHSLCTAFTYPDYHRVGDEWPKIDYDNLAAVLKGLAVGLVTVANNPKAPKWNMENPKTEPYRTAGKTLT